ncbi:hypothetical protein GE09DRAFT_762420 [Coniochaeta sp. 2T2.1]|nr:hypothetical protein GE09DRAFT_762420 [Coniochaeta sp. 2T2.1]
MTLKTSQEPQQSNRHVALPQRDTSAYGMESYRCFDVCHARSSVNPHLRTRRSPKFEPDHQKLAGPGDRSHCPTLSPRQAISTNFLQAYGPRKATETDSQNSTAHFRPDFQLRWFVESRPPELSRLRVPSRHQARYDLKFRSPRSGDERIPGLIRPQCPLRGPSPAHQKKRCGHFRLTSPSFGGWQAVGSDDKVHMS